jgi:hypothetical protein
MVPFQNTRSNDKGVSEAIGFMLIFGIVIAGIGLVTLYGYPLLIQQQVGADEKIMEKNMIVLQNDLKSLAYKTVPFKETTLKIGGGALTVYNSSYTPSIFTIDITDTAGVTYLSNPFQSGDLRYESVSAQTDISLQNGAVVMRPRIGPGSTMLAEPRWFYDGKTQTMVINLVNITSTDLMAKEGIGTVQMTLGDTNYTYVSVSPASNPVLVKYTPDPLQDYSVAWDNYFTKTLNMPPPTITGIQRIYELPPIDTLVIKKYEVQIKNI